MKSGDKYFKILKIVAYYNDIDEDNIINLLKDKESKYLLLLLLKKYKCMDKEKIMEIFKYKSFRSINYNIKKAEEKFLVNKSFREKYFEIEEILLK
ncbi:MAG: ribose-5-phosphate isomerase [Clostridium sp.]|nr:ribose-5-phosphate isomerase [Clostridium sp.]